MVHSICEDLDILDDLTSIPAYANDEMKGNQESSSSSSRSRTSSSSSACPLFLTMISEFLRSCKHDHGLSAICMTYRILGTGIDTCAARDAFGDIDAIGLILLQFKYLHRACIYAF
jgi:hypothetical protein